MIASHVGLWIVTAFLLIAVWALARQVGLLHRRLAPAGARMDTTGPRIGDVVPDLETADLFGRPVSLAAARGKQTLLVFVSPTCPVCSTLMPAVRSIQRSERKWVEIVLVSLGEDERANREYAERQRLGDIPYVLSPEIAARYQITGPPYAVLVGPDGRTQAKGLVNHMDHLESLMNTARLGHSSIESYVRVTPRGNGSLTGIQP